MVQMLHELVGDCAKEPRPVPRHGGQSLFKEIPANRSCADARVSNAFCACIPPVWIPVNDKMVVQAVEAVISHLNGKLPKECARLSVGDIITAAKLDIHSQEKLDPKQIYVTAFTTEPGEFWLEATVTYLDVTQSYVVDEHISRINRISRSLRCLEDHTFEEYCYCL